MRNESLNSLLAGGIAGSQNIQTATRFVERTILHEVESPNDPSKKKAQVFVQVGSWCSPEEWQMALTFEKEFKDINDEYRELLGKNGTWKMKDPGNILKAVVIEGQ